MGDSPRTTRATPLGVVLVHPEEVPIPHWAERTGARVLEPGALDGDGSGARLADAGCVLLDATVARFATLARHVHDADASVQVIAVTPPERLQATRRALLYAPGLGEVWVASPTEINALLTERAAGVTSQRRHFERTRARMDRERVTSSPQRAQRALISDAYLAGLLRVLPDPVFSVDATGRVLSANAAAERLFGGPGRGVVGARLGTVLGLEADGESDAALLRRAARDEHVLVRFLSSSGEQGTGDLRAAETRVGGMGDWAVLLRDVTEERATFDRLQETAMELEAANEELQSTTEELLLHAEEGARLFAAERAARERADEANRAKSQFLATMSHELRTPLNAISGHVGLVLEEIYGPVTPAQRAALERVTRAQHHLLGLINDVLSFARMESGRVEYHIVPVSATELVGSILPLVEPQLTDKGLAFEVRLPEQRGEQPAMVLADRDRAGQILVNLLSNAIKFTDAGGRIHVEVTTRPGVDGRPADACLTVRDTGVGIPADRLDVIFEPFVQLSAELTRTREGTGLGLAISRDLARAMGGELTVESTPGEGSTFTVTLPIAR